MACSRPRTAPRSASSCSGSGGLSVGTEAWATNGLRRAQRAVFACFWPLYIECCLCMHYFRFCTCKMLCMHYFRFYICKMSIVCLLYSPCVLNSALHALFCFFVHVGIIIISAVILLCELNCALQVQHPFPHHQFITIITTALPHHHHHVHHNQRCSSVFAMVWLSPLCVCKCILKALERCCRVYALHYVAWLSPLKCVGLVETYQLLLLPGAYQGT